MTTNFSAEKNIYERIGKQIKKLREESLISQENLANQMGYKSAATVSHFEAGIRKITLADLQKISEIFQVPLERLLEGEEDSSAKITFRAQQVAPSWRDEIDSFVTFARGLVKTPQNLIEKLPERPGLVAAKVLEFAQIKEPPVDPFLVAQTFNVPVLHWHFKNEISGNFVAIEGKVCIGVNENHPYVRQRFTIAHELGHMFLHWNKTKSQEGMIVDFTHQDVEASIIAEGENQLNRHKDEMEANWFAADLLMPKSWVEEDYRNANPEEIVLLANKYAVSEQAFWFRLMALKLVSQSESSPWIIR